VDAGVTLADLVATVGRRDPRLGAVRLVCVDGPAGSGKSTLARALGDALAAPVLGLDDLYEGWAGLDGVAERLDEQVLGPLAAGRPGRYQRYDWHAGRFAEWHDLPVPEHLVLEGCGSGARSIADHAVLLVWVEAPADLRLERGLARDGAHMRDHWLRWMGLEAVHFAREGTRARADVVVDGTRPLGP
jgi:hypothetical protein